MSAQAGSPATHIAYCNSDELRSQILFFRQDPNSETPLFNGGRPGQLLLLAGLALPPKMIDVDGNGYLDLQVGSWRLDALDHFVERTGPQTQLSQPVEDLAVTIRPLRPVETTYTVGEKFQRAFRRDLRIELPQAAGGRIPGIGKALAATLPGAPIELLEERA